MWRVLDPLPLIFNEVWLALNTRARVTEAGRKFHLHTRALLTADASSEVWTLVFGYLICGVSGRHSRFVKVRTPLIWTHARVISGLGLLINKSFDVWPAVLRLNLFLLSHPLTPLNEQAKRYFESWQHHLQCENKALICGHTVLVHTQKIYDLLLQLWTSTDLSLQPKAIDQKFCENKNSAFSLLTAKYFDWPAVSVFIWDFLSP